MKDHSSYNTDSEGRLKEVEKWDANPSLAEMFKEGVPPEYLAILVMSFAICITVIVLFIKAVNKHRQYMTKFTMQALCTIGVVLTFPVFTVMYFSGMLVPKAMSKVTFMAETYEAVSLLFFLRLILTYLGGKKKTTEALTESHVRLNSPPICCLVFLPKIKFSRRVLFIHELFIIQLVVLQLVLGYVDLLIGLDESHSYPAALIEETYSHYFHIFIIFSLLLAVYGLGGIYHSAEEQLGHFHIFKKFILYKAFVTVVKIEEIFLSYVVTWLVEKYGLDLTYGAFRPELRVHMWCYFIVLVEAVSVFPFLLKVYSVADYPELQQQLEMGQVEEAGPSDVEVLLAVEEEYNCETEITGL